MSAPFQPVLPRGQAISRRIPPPRTGRFSKDLALAARELDRTLADGDLSPVETRVVETTYLHTTRCQPSAEYDPKTRRINVSPASKRPATDWLHEVGHVLYLDFVRPAQELVGPTLIQGFNDACEDSDATKWLRAVADKITSLPEAQADAEYLLDSEEQFVRCFAQFVAVRSKDTGLKSEVRKWSLDGGIDMPLFWSEADFLRIDAELVTLFRRLGWIRI